MGHLATSKSVNTTDVVDSSKNSISLNFCDNEQIESNAMNKNKDEQSNNNNNNSNSDGNLTIMSENNNINNRKSYVNGIVQHYSSKSELNITSIDYKKNDLNIDTSVTDLNQLFTGPTIFGVKYHAPLKWDKIIQLTIIHILCVYPFYNYHLCKNFFPTAFWGLFMGGLVGFGVTGGAHRFWSHRAYKATLPLRIILMICFTAAGQNTIFDWVRDHRVHHKYSETDADPHNSNRGFFFAHMGWLMMHKHPEVLKHGRQIDMSDILNDPVVKFHQKYFIPLKILLCFVLPTLVPVYIWNESWSAAIFSQVVLRYVSSLHITWSVNSAAHLWGKRPYDKRINPRQNKTVAFFAMGEGWHNYHHVFPWDYKAAELGDYGLNLTTFWIDLFSKIGWAYDLKQPKPELVKKIIDKSGDGTHAVFGHHDSEVPPPNDNDMNNMKEKIDENSNHLKQI